MLRDTVIHTDVTYRIYVHIIPKRSVARADLMFNVFKLSLFNSLDVNLLACYNLREVARTALRLVSLSLIAKITSAISQSILVFFSVCCLVLINGFDCCAWLLIYCQLLIMSFRIN